MYKINGGAGSCVNPLNVPYASNLEAICNSRSSGQCVGDTPTAVEDKCLGQCTALSTIGDICDKT